MKDRFWELLKESTLVQGIIGLLFAGVLAYMYCSGVPVPQELLALFGVILGFYFGGKVEQRLKGTLIAIEENNKNKEE